jgi:thiamine transport system permease protein
MIRPRAWLALPAVIVGLAFFVWPMASIIGTGIGQDPGRVVSILTDGHTVGAIWFTTWQAAASTALTLVIGLPVTWAVSRFDFPGRSLVRTLVTIPFVLPTVVVALAFIELAGPGGLLGIDLVGTIWIVLAAHVFFNVAVVIRTVGGLWSHLDPALEDAAASLGASPWRVFTTVTLPLLRPAIAAAAGIVFLFSFTSFGVILLLGAPRLATLEVEIYRATALLPDLPVAAVLALVQVVGVTAGLMLYARFQERSVVAQHLLPAEATRRRPMGRERIWTSLAVGGALLITLTPILAIVLRAVTTGSSPLAAFRALGTVDPALVDVGQSALNSVQFAVVTAVLAVAIALPAAVLIASHRSGMGRWIDTLIMLPIGSSAVTLGFGFVVGLDAPIDIRSWWVLVPIAHVLVAMPFVARATVPVLRSISPRLREAAATLGAAPGRLWRTIDLPILSPAAAGAAALAFIISLGEFGATLFVARPGGQTMTVAIYRLLGRPGDVNLGAALGLSLVLISVTAGVVALLERSRVPGIGRF